MEKEIAKKLLNISLSAGAEYDNLLLEIKDTCSDSEFKTFRKGIGKVMGYMFVDIMSPIFEQYPDLKPPELR